MFAEPAARMVSILDGLSYSSGVTAQVVADFLNITKIPSGFSVLKNGEGANQITQSPFIWRMGRDFPRTFRALNP
jgi:hypothetical protein